MNPDFGGHLGPYILSGSDRVITSRDDVTREYSRTGRKRQLAFVAKLRVQSRYIRFFAKFS